MTFSAQQWENFIDADCMNSCYNNICALDMFLSDLLLVVYKYFPSSDN